MGLIAFFYGVSSLGPSVDFIIILVTGKNIESGIIVVFISHICTPITSTLILVVASELLIPKRKWHIILINIVLGIIWELLLFVDPLGNFIYDYPESPGENLIAFSTNYGSPMGIIYIIFILEILVLWIFGFLYKSFKSKGVIRKKFLYLSIGMIYTVIFTLFSTIISINIIRSLLSFCTASGLTFFYFGLREAPAEPKTKPPKKEFKIEEGLFRLTKRPAHISEEEISISKEKRICLVCKGELGGKMFMCSDCGAFYCDKCADALSDLENACWLCNSPFGESKPSKPYKIEKDLIYK